MKTLLQHYLNSLHVMGYLVAMGVSRSKARWFVLKYERFIHPIIY